MILTGIILTPTIRADALTDLGDLKTVIDGVAQIIGAKTNASRNWGFDSVAQGQLGTADLIQNVTTSILHANANLGSNEAKWINVTSTINETVTVNLTATGLDESYIDYVSAIPNLSVALSALGRSWHSELNQPVATAIDALQQTMTTFSSSLLQAGLVHSNSTLRTIRSSNSLEDAQTAWSRMLNLPGPSRSSSSSERRVRVRDDTDSSFPGTATLVRITFEEALTKSTTWRSAQIGPHRSMANTTHTKIYGVGKPIQSRDFRKGSPGIGMESFSRRSV